MRAGIRYQKVCKERRASILRDNSGLLQDSEPEQGEGVHVREG